MKTFQQFISEAYPKSERKSHQLRLSFLGTLDKDMENEGRSRLRQIGPGKGVPLYIPKYKGPVRGENDRGPDSFVKQTNRSKVTKRIHTNMPIQTGPYKKPDNLTL